MTRRGTRAKNAGAEEGSRRLRCQAVAAFTGERHPTGPPPEEPGPTTDLRHERELIRR